jgi:hypothetical protein
METTPSPSPRSTSPSSSDASGTSVVEVLDATAVVVEVIDQGVVVVVVVEVLVAAVVGKVDTAVPGALETPSMFSPVVHAPTKVSAATSVAHDVRMTRSLQRQDHSPTPRGIEANDPPISAHMRYLGPAGGPPILPVMRYLIDP